LTGSKHGSQALTLFPESFNLQPRVLQGGFEGIDGFEEIGGLEGIGGFERIGFETVEHQRRWIRGEG